MLTTKQVAKLKNVSVRAIQKQIERGTQKAILCPCGQSHLIDERDLGIPKKINHKNDK
jgi:hypothetical protein